MNTKKIKRTITVGALSCCLMVGAISAYFTDGDTATNTFTVGKVEIDLQEPNWDPEDVTQITPEEEFAKDPQVKNIGVNDAYVFVEVQIPCANVKTADETGAVNEAAKTQLFTYDVNPGWVKVDAGTVETGTLNTYVYAYVGTNDEGANNAVMKAVAKDATTDALFSYVRFANVVEDEGLEGEELDMVVNAYAIQTDNINDNDADIDGANDDGKTAPADVWAVVNAQRENTVLDDKTGENVKDVIG